MSAGVRACACMLARMRFYACALRFVHAVVFVRGACVRACLSALLRRRACLRTHARTCACPDRGAFSPWCALAHARMRARACMRAVRLLCPGKGRAGRRLQAGQTQSRRCIARLQRCRNRNPRPPPLPSPFDARPLGIGDSGDRRVKSPAAQAPSSRRRPDASRSRARARVTGCARLTAADSDRPAPTAGLICPTRRRTWIWIMELLPHLAET